MKIENQVCSLEQAKRLVQLGVYAPSAFLYFKATSHAGIVLGEGYLKQVWNVTGCAYETSDVNITPAYTVAELGVMLPNFYYALRHPDKWVCEGSQDALVCINDTQPKCMAEMLIYLLENNLITADEVNQRLK